jgi:myo-inositol-1(or 4)-monophosphatase
MQCKAAMSRAPLPSGLQRALDSASEAARAGGAELRRRFKEPRTIQQKTLPTDIVTDADTAAEALVLALLTARHPQASVLAEESGARHGTALGNERWIVDPLDGTSNYAHGVPHFAVSIGYEVAGTMEVGVVYDPMRDELFSAVRGHGAALNGTPIHVSTVASLKTAMLATGFPYWVSERPEQLLELFGAYVRAAQAVRRFGSAALDLAWVAAGRYDGFFELGLKAWDLAAGTLLVEAAGGRVSGVDGGPLSLDEGHVIAANAELHAPLLAIAQAARRTE